MSFVINRVYTKVGDRGTTRLAGGQEVEKTNARIEAYGTLDELNAVVGVLTEELLREPERGPGNAPLIARLRRIQNELFDLGSELAVLPEDRHPAQPLLTPADITRLEAELDEANRELPSLRSFVLPGGGMASALMHQARTVCRRAERRLVALHALEPQRAETLMYLNRLSDWMFVMGRRCAVERGQGELLWKPGGDR
jgi:cob(I)alamin adenosyltransferase